jgi:hypothetical protein
MKSGHHIRACFLEDTQRQPLGNGLFILATDQAVRDALARVGVPQRCAVAVRHGQQVAFHDEIAPSVAQILEVNVIEFSDGPNLLLRSLHGVPF